MTQDIYIIKISDLAGELVTVISDNFKLDAKIIAHQISTSLQKLIVRIDQDYYALVEAPYVDRVFRDSYYLYYSSKYGRYSRDCIKVSIFNEPFTKEEFRSEAGYKRLLNAYLGFFVIRPTEPDYLGRNVISPSAISKVPFNYCSVNFGTTVYGLKFMVTGFPHSSQDGETYSCAETTIWAIMEYFGVKYPDYSPIKPSQIHARLRNLSAERQIPSKGLSVVQISYLLKEMGFGCRIYSLSSHGKEFFRLLSCYVESGIPLAVGMDDFDAVPSNGIGHAVIIIGSEDVDNGVFDKIIPNFEMFTNQLDAAKLRNIELFDLDDVEKNYVFIDDNHPPYITASATHPAAHYGPGWANVTIKSFIVPLYPKIYLEAYEAKNFIKEFLLLGPHPLEKDQKIYIRFYLTSSRSFKHGLALSNMDNDIKDFISEKPMPKFVWIAELGTKDMIIDNIRSGIIVIDATEPNILDNKPLIVAAYQDSIIFFDGERDVLTKLSLTLHPFKKFLNNLTHS